MSVAAAKQCGVMYWVVWCCSSGRCWYWCQTHVAMTIRWHTVNKTSASAPSPLLPGLTHYLEQLASPHSRSHRPLHFEIDLDCVTTNSRAKYLGQNSFSSKVTVWTQVTQHSDCSTWPLKWSATLLYSLPQSLWCWRTTSGNFRPTVTFPANQHCQCLSRSSFPTPLRVGGWVGLVAGTAITGLDV